MKGRENVRHVVARVGENHGAARMGVPVTHIVHLVLVDDPGVGRLAVALDFAPGNLANLVGGTGGGRSRCVSSFAHDCRIVVATRESVVDLVFGRLLLRCSNCRLSVRSYLYVKDSL